jgi:hypothetical protein
MLVLLVLPDIGSCICADARGIDSIIIDEGIPQIAATNAEARLIENLVF